MRQFSEHVVGQAAESASEVFRKTDLSRVFVTAGLGRFVPTDSSSKGELVSNTVRAALAEARKGDEAVAEGLARFTTRVVERAADRGDAEEEGSHFSLLREALRADGYDVHLEWESTRGSWSTSSQPRVSNVRILPLDDAAAPMTATITALAADLSRLGLDVAANCYRQAIDALADGRFESANGQIRATYEEVLAQAAVATGFVRSKQGVGGAAIAHLIKNVDLNESEGKYIQGLWGMTHTNGPHPGTTTAGEAQFRVQAITTATRYVVDKFFD